MFTGSMVALVTPMQTDGSIDQTATERLLELHMAAGTDAIVISGTTGESATLEPEEQSHLLKITLKHVKQGKRKMPIIAGTGSNSTKKAIFLAKQAEALGVEAILVVTPYYNKPTQDGLYAHYRTIAEAVQIPIILYNVPGRTGCDLLPETVSRLSRISNIIGIKEAVPDLARLKALQALCSSDFYFYSGDDATAKDFMLLGGHGVISVTANVVPLLMKKLCDAALSRQQGNATQVDEKLAPLHQALFIESNPIPVKWALATMGLIAKGIRLPLTWLSERYESRVRLALETAGIL